MLAVAITGSICSGKSTVAKLFSSFGAEVFDADKVIHQYYKNPDCEVFKAVKKVFPDTVLDDKTICRNRLGEIVFSSAKKLQILEDIVHPAVIENLKIWLAKNKNSDNIFFAEVPLLFEKNLCKIVDRIILVKAPQSILLDRIEAKFQISQKEAVNRLNLFIPISDKEKMSDFIIENNKDINHLKQEVKQIWQKLKRG